MLGMNGPLTAITLMVLAFALLGTISVIVGKVADVRIARWKAYGPQQVEKQRIEDGYLDSLGGPSSSSVYDRKKDTPDGR